MPDTEQVRAVLAALADDETPEPEPAPSSDYRTVIEEGVAATRDLEAAAAFVEEGGIERLEAAVRQARREVSDCAEPGAAALDAFREFRRAAAGDQFHRGHDTSLGGDDLPRDT
ncbi:MAG: hypothetical protein ABEJ89_00680 [Haloarculaceae archaeon]